MYCVNTLGDHEKPTLVYCAEWESEAKTTWSGTTYALRQALERHFSIHDLRLPRMSSIDHMWSSISKRIGINDLSIHAMKKQQDWCNLASVPSCGDLCFQFSEVPELGKWRYQYIYQDLCVEWLLDCRNSNPDLFRWTGFSGVLMSAMKQRAEKQRTFYKGASGVFVMGRWMADYLVQELGVPEAKVHHVGGGINSRVYDCCARNQNTFLFVGRDFYRKGGDLVIEAFRHLHEEDSNLRLIIAGPTRNPAQGVAGIEYVGDASNEKVGQLFSTSDVFCMPSRFEAYGLVFPEALSAGLPCVGRDAFEMPYFIRDGENGKLVRSDDPLELASAMKECLTSDRIRCATLADSESVCREYSWRAVAERIYEIISNDILHA